MTSPHHPAPPAPPSSIADLLASDALRSVYQPIVDVWTGEPLAYEALLRGPVGHPLEMPGALFPTAAREGLSSEVEWAGVRCAIEGALAAGIGSDTSLFVNVEGSSVDRPLTASQDEVMDRARRGLHVVMEVTERDLLARPGHLLHAAARLQQEGWGLAIDDVGLDHAEGMATLPLVRPDIVKLDMGLIRGRPSAAQAKVGLAVRAFVEEHGGEVVAEGIEDEADLERAMVLGATLGQGWHFGRPGPLPDRVPAPSRRLRLRHGTTEPTSRTPYDIARSRLSFRVATKRTLIPMSRQLELMAEQHAPEVVVFGAFQDRVHFTSRSRETYGRLSESCALVAAFAAGLDASPVGRVRGADLDPGDPLAGEWTVVVLSPHHAAALIGRDLEDGSDRDLDRRFAFAITHDRALVTELGRALMARIADRSGVRVAVPA